AVLALHHHDVAPRVPDNELFLLDQRLQRERGLARRGKTDLDLVRHVVVEMGFEPEANRIALAPDTGPKDGLDTTFGGDGAGDRAVGSSAQQREAVVKVGLADAVAADEHRQPADRQEQAADRAIAFDRDGGERHASTMAVDAAWSGGFRKAARGARDLLPSATSLNGGARRFESYFPPAVTPRLATQGPARPPGRSWPAPPAAAL